MNPNTLFQYKIPYYYDEDNKGPNAEWEPTYSYSDFESYVVKKITFNIGRWGAVKKTLEFEPTVNGKEAIESVEKWLSQPLTKSELNILRNADDLYNCSLPLSYYKNRGYALGDCTDLSNIKYDNSTNHMVLRCDS